MARCGRCRTITDLLRRFGYNKEAKAPHKYGGYFRNDADHRDFVGIGTAAGQTAAFTCQCFSVERLSMHALVDFHQLARFSHSAQLLNHVFFTMHSNGIQLVAETWCSALVSLSHSLAHSLSHSLAHSLTRSLTHSLACSPTCTPNYSSVTKFSRGVAKVTRGEAIFSFTPPKLV